MSDIQKYKLSFIEWAKKDLRLRYEINHETAITCMMSFVVKKNNMVFSVRLQDWSDSAFGYLKDIVFWSANDDYSFEMNDSGFRDAIVVIEKCMSETNEIWSYNNNGERINGIEWRSVEKLNAQDVLDYWEAHGNGEDDCALIVYETFFGDTKYAFKRERGQWVETQT